MLKMIILDVDGTLTDGSIIIDGNGMEIKNFSVLDGLIMRILPEIGIKTVILTGRKSEAVRIRAENLDITHIMQGISDKEAALNELNINLKETAYIGDDLNDYAAMQMCGFKACPANAVKEIKEICDYISPFGGGHGAVRDIIEYILKKQNQWNDVLEEFRIKKRNASPLCK